MRYAHPSNLRGTYDACTKGDCAASRHSWHGLPCESPFCDCPSSFEEPEGETP